MKIWNRHWCKGIAMALIVALSSLPSGCSSFHAASLKKNIGDYVVSRLQPGMTEAEVGQIVAAFGEAIESYGEGAIPSDNYLFMLYQFDYYPKSLLRDIDVGEPYRMLAYPTNPAGGQSGGLHLFFDKQTRKLNGWVNYPSLYSKERFMHERLTSQVQASMLGLENGMSREEVYALIGKPEEIVELPRNSRSIYEDHYWLLGPNFDSDYKIEVYSYPLESGAKRRVYLYYYPAADELLGWGYDHAWEEAERYLREQQGAELK